MTKNINYKSYIVKKIIDVVYLLRKGIQTYKNDGCLSFWAKIKYYGGIKFNILMFQKKPTISIIMPVYNIGEIWLERAIISIINQFYKKWELCIVDDASTEKHVHKLLNRYLKEDNRIKVKYLPHNTGIANASNDAFQMATGEYLTLMDHDDMLTNDALFEIVKAINKNDPDIIYSDEDLIDKDDRHIISHFKPHFSPDLLLSHNYITHLLAFKKSLFLQVNGFSSDCNGAQDYDLILKLIEKTDKIYHIPKILYHWRKIETAVSENPDSKMIAVNAGLEVLRKTIKRRNIQGSVEKINSLGFYRIKRALSQYPLVSIVIPFKDKADLLRKCIQSIVSKSVYQNYEIIGLSNNSIENDTFQAMDELQKTDSRIRFIEYNTEFNYPKINNYAVSNAHGEHIVLMNNDIEIINQDWIEALLEHSQRNEVGAVGAKLYYPNDTVQHAGIIVGIGGFAGHSHKYEQRQKSGYFYRLKCIQNISAVTGALMMVKKRLFEEVEGFDEEYFKVALNDVDFSLKLRKKGYLNIFTPFCEAYHYESASRGYEDTPEKESRFNIEIKYFQKKWNEILKKGDPYYNINLTLEREDFSVKVD